VALGVVSTAAVVAPSAVYAAAEQAKPKLSKPVAVPLAAAQKAAAAKQWDVAAAEIKKAQAVEKRTPVEDYWIDEILGYTLVAQKKYSQAAPVYERTLNSGLMPPEQVDERIRAVAQIYSQEQDDKKTIEWTKKYLAKHPGDEDMSARLAYAYFGQKDYKSASATMSGLVSSIEKSGQTPKENYLQIVRRSEFELDNKDAMAEATKKLVRYYPKPEDWKILTDIYSRKQNSGRVTLGFYRLMNEVGVLKDKGDFDEAAKLALEAGVPGEAESLVQKGIDIGVLKSDDKTEQGRFDRLISAAKKQAADDRQSLEQDAKNAEKATQGQPSVGLGQAYLSYGMYEQAIAALQAGIKKGGVTDLDEAQVSLGIAQLKKGLKDQARQSFKAVKPDSKWADLASLWTLRTYQS